MTPFAANTTAETDNAFEWAGQAGPPKLPLPLGNVDPTYYMVPWAHHSQPFKRHLDQFSRFCRAQEGDRQTDTQTDHAILRR